MPIKDLEARGRYQQAYAAKNRDRLREMRRRWRLSSKEHLNACRRRKYATQPETEYDYRLRRRYEMTLAEYRQIEERQGGVCAICQRPPKKRLTVDHDHASGKVRGLLCHGCNIAIGQLCDSPEILLRAASYIASHRDEAAVA